MTLPIRRSIILYVTLPLLPWSMRITHARLAEHWYGAAADPSCALINSISDALFWRGTRRTRTYAEHTNTSIIDNPDGQEGGNSNCRPARLWSPYYGKCSGWVNKVDMPRPERGRGGVRAHPTTTTTRCPNRPARPVASLRPARQPNPLCARGQIGLSSRMPIHHVTLRLNRAVLAMR